MPNDINKLRRIMRQANMLANQSPANGNRSYALRVAHRIEDIRTDLRNGYVHFSYVKADGSIRVALGTLNPALIPADKTPTTHDMLPSRERLGIINYYDLNKDDWRCFYFFALVEDGYHAVPLNG